MASAPHPSISPAQHQSGVALKFTILLKPLPTGWPPLPPRRPRWPAPLRVIRGIPRPSGHEVPPQRRRFTPGAHSQGAPDDATSIVGKRSKWHHRPHGLPPNTGPGVPLPWRHVYL